MEYSGGLKKTIHAKAMASSTIAGIRIPHDHASSIPKMDKNLFK